MEASVKERLTGALILVAVLAVVVPEMLSGPKAPPRDASVVPAQPAEAGAPLRTYRMTLGDNAQPAPPLDSERVGPATLPASVPAEAPAPAAATPVVAAEKSAAPPPQAVAPEAKAPTPPAVTNPPAAKPEKQPEQHAAVAAKPAQATGKWWAQLGSFAAQGNAERLARQLRSAGFNVDVSKVKAAGKELYRVRAGPVADRAAAEAMQARLAAAGNKSTLVGP